MTTIHHFAWRISERVQYDELRMQRMLGADWIDAYSAAWRIMDEVHELVLAPERPAVYGQKSVSGALVSNPNSTWGRR